MCVTPGFLTERLGFLGKRLAKHHFAAFGVTDNFVSRDLQKPRVHRVADGLLLRRSVNDDALELSRLDRFDRRGGVDGRLENGLHPGLVNGVPEASNLRRVTGQSRLVVIEPAEVLPNYILRPTENERLIA